MGGKRDTGTSDDASPEETGPEEVGPATRTWSPGGPTGAEPVRSSADQIGPYRLLGILGQGGMGTVYRAEQSEPVNRKVALKVIRENFTSAMANIRFAAERQAMARLNHVNVGQIFEAGTTEEGWPYFVMEHIDGADLLAYCDQRRLPLEDRLRLFMGVCMGVQHAHQRGIMHRDLKPQNVLVTEIDGRPLAKVIDFGIARALDGSLTGTAQLTSAGMIGTPAYMSPEALPMSGGTLDLDTRTDVYALGIILYELLCGGRPFRELEGKFVKLMIGVTQRDPPKPSASFAAMPEAKRSEMAERRRADPADLAEEMRGDLDWIVSMAIARDREERYGSASEFAADIERYLTLEPVVASPPSWRYVLRKFVRRNRLQVAAASAVATALVLAVIGTSVGMVRANQEADRANIEAERANRTARIADESAGFLADLFAASEVGDDADTARKLVDVHDGELWTQVRRTGDGLTAREVLDIGAKMSRDSLEKQPRLRARMMYNIAASYINLRLYREAVPLLLEAIEIRKDLDNTVPNSTALFHFTLGEAYVEQGRYDEGLDAHQTALAIRAFNDDTRDFLVAESHFEIGRIYNRQGRYREAETPLRDALAMREQIYGMNSRSVAETADELALMYTDQGQFDLAEPLYQRALAIAEEMDGPNSSSVATKLNNFALMYDSRGRSEEAVPLYLRGLEITEGRFGPDHQNLAPSLNNLALVYDRLGQHEEAEALFRRALAINIRVLGPDHPTVGICLNNLAVVLGHRGLYEDAEPHFQRALAIYEDKLGTDHPRYARTLFRYAEWHIAQGLLTEAVPMLERAMEIQAEKLPADHPKALATVAVYAALLEATGRTANP